MAEFEEKEIATERDADLPIPDILPVLPLKDVVVFPYIILPLSVSREKSINAVDAALAEQRIIMLVAQQDGQNDTPRPNDLYTVGTVAAIMRMLKLPDGRIRLLVQGLSRARVDSVLSEEPYLKAKITRLEETPDGRGAAARARGPAAQRQAEPREVGLARQEHLARGHGHRRQPRRSGAPGRPGGVEPRPEARGRAEHPRVDRPDRAPAPGQRQPREGDHRADDAAGDLLPGARRDGQVRSASTTCASSSGRSSRSSARARRSPRSSTPTARSSPTRRSRRRPRPRSRSRSSASSAATPTRPRRRSSARTSTG